MKMRSFSISILIAAFAGASAGASTIAFERSDAVWVANLDGSGEKKIADGIFPAISPDGAQVAFNTVEKSQTTYMRHIAVAEVATGATAVLTQVPSDNSYYPVWAPDGKRILFLLRQNEVWNLATMAASGTDFQILKRGAQNHASFYSPCWARDGKSIFCQDMTNIYRIGLDGTVLSHWRIEKIVPGGGMSGDGRIAVSPDGKRLLLSVDMAEQSTRTDWDGPPPALWTFEIATGKAVRITRPTIFGWDGCWIDNNNVLFLRQPAGEKSASIYRMSLDGKNLKRLIRNALFPTVS
jgi:TolB protein